MLTLLSLREDARRGWSEKGAGGREDRGERGGGKQGKQERLGEKEEAKTERKRFPLGVTRADSSSFSPTIWAASEHNQEIHTTCGTLLSFDDLLPCHDLG